MLNKQCFKDTLQNINKSITFDISPVHVHRTTKSNSNYDTIN